MKVTKISDDEFIVTFNKVGQEIIQFALWVLWTSWFGSVESADISDYIIYKTDVKGMWTAFINCLEYELPAVWAGNKEP